MKKQLLLALGLVFIFAAVSIELAYEQFLILNRGVVDNTLKDVSAFYGYISLTWVTIAWYFVSGLIVWFAIYRIKKANRTWIGITGIIALFLAPGIFVDPNYAPNVSLLLSATNFETPSLVLPAWVSILRYWLESPYFLYRLTAILTTVWTILLTWFVLLGVSLSVHMASISRR